MEHEELIIPLTFGYASAKAFNDPSGLPVMLTHGYFQNANVFDELIPLLPKSWYLVAIEAFGFGKSSMFPEGCSIEHIDIIKIFRIISQTLKWNRFVIVAHSASSGMAMAFGSFYPEFVQCLVVMDCYALVQRQIWKDTDANWSAYVSRIIHEQVTQEMQNKLQMKLNLTSEQSYEFFANTLVERLPEKATRLLMKRCVEENDDGTFMYNLDKRTLKSTVMIAQNEKIWNMIVENFNCHLLIIKFNDGFNFPAGKLKEEKLAQLNKHCKSLQYVEVEGQHCAVLTNPKPMVPYIIEFITKHSQENDM